MPKPAQPHPEAGVLCPKCLLANPPTAAFCADCGAPIGMVAATDPLQSIQAEGFAYRSAVDGPPKLIILIGMWLIFGPALFVIPFFLSDGFENGPVIMSIAVLWTLVSVIILYRATKNYIVKSRS